MTSILLAAILGQFPADVFAREPAPLPPAILSRAISQHGGSWTIAYTLRCPPGHRPATVALSSWVANSRCGDPRTGHPHARPRWSSIIADVPSSRGPGGTSSARSLVLM